MMTRRVRFDFCIMIPGMMMMTQWFAKNAKFVTIIVCRHSKSSWRIKSSLLIYSFSSCFSVRYNTHNFKLSLPSFWRSTQYMILSQGQWPVAFIGNEAIPAWTNSAHKYIYHAHSGDKIQISVLNYGHKHNLIIYHFESLPIGIFIGQRVSYSIQ